MDKSPIKSLNKSKKGFRILFADYNSSHLELFEKAVTTTLLIQPLRLVVLAHWGRVKMAAICADDILKCIFLNKKWISIKISLKCIPKGPIDNMTALVQIMAWRRTDHYLNQWWPRLPIHMCVTRPQWVNRWVVKSLYGLNPPCLNDVFAPKLVPYQMHDSRVCRTSSISSILIYELYLIL